MKALEDAGRGDCDECGWSPHMKVEVAWDHDDEEGQEDQETEYCRVCGNPSVLVVQWPDQETLEERGGGGLT